jgi:histidyl-tRNA synthetase
MSEKKIKAIYGTRDILPDEAPIWQHVITTVASLASYYNYHMIHPPIFEATELFARGIGETTDIVSKEMYTFTDQGDRSLTLRPEATASVVRAYLEHSMAAREGMVKVWYLGPMFRQERPQAGRFRQFYQFGVEAIGSLDPAIDAEVITLNFRILSALGLEGLKIHINSIGMPEDRQAHRKAFVEFVAPKLDQFCQDCQKRFQTNPLRMFDCKEPRCKALLELAPLIFNFLTKENKDHFFLVGQYLSKVGIHYQFDPGLVRGLDYYTRTAWEIKSDKLGSQDSLSGGGRYDLLVEQLGGSPTPGIGFAAGIERIIMAMPKSDLLQDERKLGVFVATMDDKYRTEAFRLIDKVRRIGVPADIDYLGKSLKAQMKQANKSDLSHVVILAENELSRGMVAVKNMNNSEQFEVELERIYKLTTAAELGELLDRR